MAVVLARVDNFGAGDIFLDELPEAQRDVQAEILFEQSMRAFCPGVEAAVAGIDDDAVDLQAQFAREGKPSIGVRALRCENRWQVVLRWNRA